MYYLGVGEKDGQIYVGGKVGLPFSHLFTVAKLTPNSRAISSWLNERRSLTDLSKSENF
jgi:hypothetical protein